HHCLHYKTPPSNSGEHKETFNRRVCLPQRGLLPDVDCVKHHEQIDCSKYKMLPLEERFCYDIYTPICGSDGKTYGNDCYFCYEVEKTNNKLKFVHFGKC
uniref:Uncharacterized protein n=1 Tax=Ovis aries TaxID=9940 RepID=A0AC11CGP0_SHEEP